MAKLDKSGSIVGRLGELRFYKLNNETIVATKGGPSSKQFKTSKNYQRTREFGFKFGNSSKVASAITKKFKSLSYMCKPQLYQSILSRLIKLYDRDIEHDLNEQHLIFSKNNDFFNRFDLSSISYGSYCFFRPMVLRLSDTQVKIESDSPLFVNNLFHTPPGYQEVHWTCYLLGIKDIEYNQKMKKYEFASYKDLRNLELIKTVQYQKYEKLLPFEHIITVEKEFQYFVILNASFISKANNKMPPMYMLEIAGMV